MTDIAARLANLTPDERAQLSARLAKRPPRPAAEPIAIIGIGCRFPGGATSPEAFWERLLAGMDAIRRVPEDRWSLDGANAGLSRWGAFLDGLDQFDRGFFGFSPREAAHMDPQQRLLLETAWEALEDAGQMTDRLAESATGVFIGAHSHSSDYFLLQAEARQGYDTYSATGSAHSILANRLSFLFDLRGPSLAIDTACSSSLVAVHLACQSLRTGESDLAIAGGVNLMLTPDFYGCLSHMEMLSPDGRCKTFDHRANGFVRGEGCGVVVLKRLADAQRDGDPVTAVILGSAVNQDGASNGLTAPNGLAQQAVISRALDLAQVAPGEIGYVETHGTGTELGDPIEVEALATVLRARDGERGACVLGALKTNIGHLEGAAGIAGLIKVALALENEAIPGNLHLDAINPHLVDDVATFDLPASPHAWPRSDRRRVAGVSSFGFGGTNAHVILGEAPIAPAAPVAVGGAPLLLPISARSEPALRALAEAYVTFLEGLGTDVQANDLAHTAAHRRLHHEYRMCAVGTGPAAWAASLRRQMGEVSSLVPDQAASHTALAAAAARYRAGETLDWTQFAPIVGKGVALPRYAWDRQSYWLPGAVVPSGESKAAGAIRETVPSPWLYELAWPSAAPPGSVQANGQGARGHYLIVNEGSDVALALADRLRGRGDACRVVTTDIAQVIAAANTDLQAVVFVAAKTSALATACAGLLAVTQGLLRTGINPVRGLWIVTQGCQPVGAMCESALGQSLLWGLGRGISAEAPDLAPAMLDLDPQMNADAAAGAILAELDHPGAEDQIVLRNGVRHVPRVRPLPAETSTVAPLAITGRHLVTGGLGGIGSRLALELARAGATELVLVVKRPLPDRSSWGEIGVGDPDFHRPDFHRPDFHRIETIRQLEATGVKVIIEPLDFMSEAALPALFDSELMAASPLNGVWHAAMWLAAQELADLDADNLAATIAVKARAARQLHELTLGRGLDQFVLFSSTTALWGARELTHYAAANAYLDALAHARRTGGDAATVINWGTWEIIERLTADQQALAARTGLKIMPAETAFAALWQMVASGRTQTIVADIDWTRFKPAYEARRARPLLAEVDDTQPDEKGADEPGLALMAELDAASSHERERIIRAVVTQALAAVLALDPGEPIERNRGFFELGMDSFTSVQLRRRLETALGRSFSNTVAFTYPTIDALSAHIGEMLYPAASPAPAAAPASAARMPAIAALDADDASEDELFELLAARLSPDRMAT